MARVARRRRRRRVAYVNAMLALSALLLLLLLLPCARTTEMLLPEPAVRLTFVSQSAGPVIDTLSTPGTEDNQFGFEGGRAIKQGGRYYYFAAEMFAQPLDANMRVALWSAAAPDGPWRRERTIQQSNQSYPLLSFTQQCNQPYCTWKGAVRNRFVMQTVYDCDASDLLASPWAPFPIFCEAENAWHVLFVSYMCDGTWFVAVGVSDPGACHFVCYVCRGRHWQSLNAASGV